MKFTYSSGQRPLEGYTLKRGVGRGGFGEVYYGVSDGGKEVALKLIRGNLEVELRGIAQCLNFKHPNLVALYDLRTDAHGDHWVVMEYVAGETLHTLLNRYPQGVPVELAREWFQGLAAAVGYLHDHGIVHRDLKPGNIFVENGVVKVGDYGLAKFISDSQRNPQTQSVGTVHYMAPEISTGNYGKQIDVYAAGVLLYELLTGHVPFEGESAGEILMKHLTTPPDLSRLPVEFIPILSRALSKNPTHRYRTMAEMAREVADTAGQAQPAPRAAQAATLPVTPEPTPAPPSASARTQVANLAGSMALAALLAVLLCILWAAIRKTNDVHEVGMYFFLTVAASWAVLLPSRLWTAQVEDSWSRRLVLMSLGLGIGVGTIWLEGYDLAAMFSSEARAGASSPQESVVLGAAQDADRGTLSSWLRRGPDLPAAACYLAYFGVAFFALRWWKMAELRRAQRFSLYSVLAAGFWGYVLLWLWPRDSAPAGLVALVMASVIVQLVSPWEAPPPPRSRKLRLRYA